VSNPVRSVLRRGLPVGIFKEMKSIGHDSPTRIEQAKQMAAHAQPLGGGYRAQADSWGEKATVVGRRMPAASDFEPIATVSLELYAQISKSLATIDYDLSQSIRLAVDKGISEENWTFAVEGWNARMAVNPAVGSKFSALYAAS
jgi:hypothetical protein